MFFRRYTEKVWGKPCEELSADWVAQRSKGLSIWTVRGRALSNRKSNVQSLIEEFMYPRDGYMRIPNGWPKTSRRLGHRVLLNAAVKGIVRARTQRHRSVYTSRKASAASAPISRVHAFR
jgi:protoporphyrinogen oxidase